MRALLTLLACCVSVALGAAETPPAPGTPKDFRLPPKVTRALANGLQVTYIEYGEIPKVTVSAVTRVGNLNEGTDSWLADITGEMLKEGAGPRSATQMAEDAAAMGGSVGVGVGPDETSVSMDVLTENGPKAAAMIADVLRRPTLPASEFDRIKRDFERQLALARTQPQSLAVEAFLNLVYPDHPYGRVYPSTEQLRAYSIDHVRRFHGDNFGAARTRIYVAGRFDRAAMDSAIDAAFGDWVRGPAPMIAPPTAAARPQLKLIDRPDAPQSTIILGLPVVDPSHPSFLKVSVTNTLLAGSFSSRITTNIREGKGYTYSPSGSLSTRYRSAYWSEQADVTTTVTGPALKEIFAEIERLRREPPTAAELKGFQNYRAGIFVIQNATRGALVNQLAFIDLHGLPDDYLTRYVERVYAVTPEDVTTAARESLDPAGMTLVVVGDLKKIRAQLEAVPQVRSRL
jgi:zinc protease